MSQTLVFPFIRHYTVVFADVNMIFVTTSRRVYFISLPVGVSSFVENISHQVYNDLLSDGNMMN